MKKENKYMAEKFTTKWIVKPVPKCVKDKTRYNYNYYRMGLADSFQDAVRNCPNLDEELKKAFYTDDFRAYIPSAYLKEYLDFNKYPLYHAN